MSHPSAAAGDIGRSDLGREADFSLGGARVRPAAREVVAGGQRIRLQPRVMQVLVALARAGGRPVSREALVEACWGPFTLGDDALNRCIQKLRGLGRTDAPGAFEIETVPRVGYCLLAGPATALATPERGVRGHELGLVAAGGAAAVALAVVGAAVWRPAPPRWSVERSERLVSTPLAERHPAISPDGAMLAYSAGPDVVSRHIYLKPLAGGNAIQLTDDAFDDAAPAWSPDGARVLYTAYRAGEPCRIMVTAVPAGPARQVARCQGAERSRAAWSARGEALFFADSATPAGPARIVRLDLATGRRQAVSHPPGGLEDDEPALSPDGRWLAIFRHSEALSLAVLHDLKTGRERAIADLGETGGLAWSADSGTLFLAGGNGVESTIWGWPMPGGPRVAVATVPMIVERLAFGRGGLLAAEIIAGRFNAVHPPGPGGSAPAVVDPATAKTWSPAYSPDGSLAVISDRSGGAGVWLSRPGAPARLLIGLGNGSGHGLSWSPDGAFLAFSAARDGEVSLRVIGLAGEARADIPVRGVAAGRPAWSADGRSLVFPVRDGGGWRLWRANLARPARPWPITGYGWAAVRAAGDTLYAVRSDRPGVWRLGPPPRLIAAGFSGRSREAWTIDKNEIVFADDGEAGRRRLLAAPLSGGPARAVAAVPGATFETDFAIDPRSGTPTYIAVVNADTDIELFHLAR